MQQLSAQELINRGIEHLNQHEAERALDIFHILSDLHPVHPFIQYYLSLSLYSLGKYKDSLGALEQVNVQLEAGHPMAQHWAMCRAMTGDLAGLQHYLSLCSCRLPVHFSLCGDRPTFALTIDDGPSPAATPLILDILNRHQCRANFFVLGERAIAHPDLMVRMVAEGHGVFSHGWSHRPFPQLSSAEIITEMAKTEAVLSGFRPTPTPYFCRLPYGVGWDQPHIHQALGQWSPSCQLVQWGGSMNEWIHIGRQQSSEIQESIERAVRIASQPTNLKNGIILCHDDLAGVDNPLSGVIGPICLDLLLRNIGNHRDSIVLSHRHTHSEQE